MATTTRATNVSTINNAAIFHRSLADRVRGSPRPEETPDRVVTTSSTGGPRCSAVKPVVTV